MIIRKALEADLDYVLSVEQAAFGKEDEAILVRDLLNDQSAKPTLSLLAFDGDIPVGHILFSNVTFEPKVQLSASILAPLAVIPDYQKQGLGGKLIKEGLCHLNEMNVDLVFVLGYPGYYPRHGFTPASVLGFETPYPIPKKNADAWMVKALRPNIICLYSGNILVAESLSRPEYW